MVGTDGTGGGTDLLAPDEDDGGQCYCRDQGEHVEADGDVGALLAHAETPVSGCGSIDWLHRPVAGSTGLASGYQMAPVRDQGARWGLIGAQFIARTSAGGVPATARRAQGL